METVFLNGPIQNSDFTFRDNPFKATGIHIAESANRLISGSGKRLPHLWNTVLLANDVRFAQQNLEQDSRSAYEEAMIYQKYNSENVPQSEIVTDADEIVVSYVDRFLDSALESGRLSIEHTEVSICRNCEHILGAISQACTCGACGSHEAGKANRNMLVEHLKKRSDIYNQDRIFGKRVFKQLANDATHVPDQLILSRTRAHGISLERIGLQGLVLDPRVGLHATVLATASNLKAETVYMPSTQKAAANIMAYGRAIIEASEMKFKYAIHGKLPVLSNEETEVRMFTNWYLPLYSLTEPGLINPKKTLSLFCFFQNSLKRCQRISDDEILERNVIQKLKNEDLTWLTDKKSLSTVLASTARYY